MTAVNGLSRCLNEPSEVGESPMSMSMQMKSKVDACFTTSSRHTDVNLLRVELQLRSRDLRAT